MRSILLVLFFAGLATAADTNKAARQEAVKAKGIERAFQKKIAKEWEIFSRRFVIREVVPIYSGPYHVGNRVVETPNYAAIQEYQDQLDVMAWNSMSDQQKRDLA